jgi:hypothetical protein
MPTPNPGASRDGFELPPTPAPRREEPE